MKGCVIIEKRMNIGPTVDFVFKFIFGKVGNEKITQGLISAILGKEINNINLNENPILEKDILSNKLGILDIKTTFNNNVCDIEMQMQEHPNFEERMLYYWSRLYAQNLNCEENDYIDLNKIISIQILDFEPRKLKNLTKFHSKWNIMESECSNSVLTEHLEFHIISLEKFRKKLLENNNFYKENKLSIWAQFLSDPDSLDEKILEENEDIRMAKKELDKFRENTAETYIAELKLKAIRDERARMKFAREEGREEGAKERNIIIAEKMLKNNMSIEDIMYLTELTKEEIQKLIKKSNT